MAHVIAEPCIGVKDASCVGRLSSGLHSPKERYNDGRPGFDVCVSPNSSGVYSSGGFPGQR
jgi:hypothetical protein